MCSCRAAREKLRFSATATKYRRWNVSIGGEPTPRARRGTPITCGGVIEAAAAESAAEHRARAGGVSS
ncbi:hypothetical protein GCM10027174_39870 [Salinifilum aidingensis]